MNIFVLDNDINKCAEYHCNCHVVKMITETVQILCSTYYYTSQSHLSPYKLSHSNHPCCKWVRESLSNWLWLQELGLALYQEYQYRYGNKIHKAGDIILQLNKPNLPDMGITKRPQAMPDEYKELDPVKAYRQYYIGDKQHILKYTKREIPEWIKL
jgi:hypothetical protein